MAGLSSFLMTSFCAKTYYSSICNGVLPPEPSAAQAWSIGPSSANRSGEVTPLKDQIVPPPSFAVPLRQPPIASANEGFRTIVIAFGLISAAVTVALLIQIATGQAQVPPHGGVASCSSVCSDLGVRTLKRGGNAVDAAIATMLCIGLVNPQYAGIGGGGFMVIHDHKKHESFSIDFRESAPQKSASALFADADDAHVGGKAVAVPGELMGVRVAHEKYGRLKWSSLFDDVIALALNGFNVTEAFLSALQRRRLQSEKIGKAVDRFERDFSNRFARGLKLSTNTIIARPDLANVFRSIAKYGVDYFYGSPLAEEIVEEVQHNGGFMTLEDLRTYKVHERPTLKGEFKDYVVETMSTPSSGSILLLMLNLLGKYAFDKHAHNSSSFYHYFGQVVATAGAFQQQLGDGNLTKDEELEFASETFASEALKGITEGKLPLPGQVTKGTEAHAAVGETGISPPTKMLVDTNITKSLQTNETFDDKGTSHISVIDNDELMVSVTHTINDWFGSLILTKSGLLLNSEMGDFDIAGKQMHANRLQPQKRPLSSMVPCLVYHKTSPCKYRIAIGATNGTRIPSGVAQVLANILGFGLRIPEAVAAPRLYCSPRIGQTNICELQKSESISEGLLNELRDLGHNVRVYDEPANRVEVVAKLNTTVEAFSDLSNNGKASVY